MNVEEVKQALGENQQLVDVTVEGNNIIVRSKEFIKAKGVWTAITNALRNMGGEWVPANKNSHWRVPLTTNVSGNSLPHIVTVCPHCGKELFIKVEKR